MAGTNIKLSGGTPTKKVTIGVIGDEEILQKKLQKISPPTSTANRDSGPKPMRIMDLLMVTEVVSIDGFLLLELMFIFFLKI